MYLILIALSVVAAVVTAGTALFVVAMINAIVSFWSNGVMANYRSDPQSAPSIATLMSMVSTLAAIGLLVAGLVIK